ncbi:hypothetical protein [Leptospira sp. GIMC2001]|uniref:hypothetical protein n=1 Tax=Leptospira sp. GIMC2001 TaxID=1513297 RepID=UPI00234A8A35|nr:hypothetical protein [Leptospira sp. GIMC2001]WCL48348.1 hypothetical protein O4O04_13665 [Leptospira sp. GIMC2001]
MISNGFWDNLPARPNFAIVIILVSYLSYKLLFGFTTEYYQPFKQDFRAAAQYLIDNNKNSNPIYSFNSTEYYNYYFDHLPHEQELVVLSYEYSKPNLLEYQDKDFFLIESHIELDEFPKDLIGKLDQKYNIFIHKENGLTIYKLNKKK